jgi:hypothetical protein
MHTETSSTFKRSSLLMDHPSHTSIQRIGLALAMALTAAGLLVAGASNARADACTSVPVVIGTKQDVQLKRSMRLTVHATCEDTYDATARGYLYIETVTGSKPGHRTGRLRALKLTGVQTTPTTTTITIPNSVLSATRSYARRGNHHYRYATLKFIVTATDRTTGLRFPYGYSTFSRLRV